MPDLSKAEKDAAYYKKNRKVIRAKQKVYMLENYEKIYPKQLEWARANKEKVNAANRAFRKRLRAEVFKAYGAICKCCGDTHEEFLTLDHVNGGGGGQRRVLGNSQMIYAYVKAHGFPPEFRILCMNCNHTIGRLGYCPHKRNAEGTDA